MRIILLDRPAEPARVVAAGAAERHREAARKAAPLTRAPGTDKQQAGVALAAAVSAPHIG
ncbi:hypothetical protein MKK67_19020 [Methylobacterium sp. J-072]|uniref:hypothetical protein n=1 Tax=Methylobacterium sp. J-072 TaxID=2836651 RepID=UPI001FB908EE|nr:hypothetical protein [Methylobacterium sp. J-072]MCJ2094567.1 hypothetical protein [Methylobacterium sp. J-072]